MCELVSITSRILNYYCILLLLQGMRKHSDIPMHKNEGRRDKMKMRDPFLGSERSGERMSASIASSTCTIQTDTSTDYRYRSIHIPVRITSYNRKSIQIIPSSSHSCRQRQQRDNQKRVLVFIPSNQNLSLLLGWPSASGFWMLIV